MELIDALDFFDEPSFAGRTDNPPLLRWVFAFYLLLLPAALSAFSLHTLHLVDSFALIGMAEMPAVAVLVAFAMQDSEEWPFRETGAEQMALLRARALFVLALFALPAPIILAANERLDRVPQSTESVLVTGKFTVSLRGGRKTFKLAIAPPLPSPLHDCWLTGHWAKVVTNLTAGAPTPVPVKQDEYERAEPGFTALRVAVHKGRFGFPWMVAEPLTP